MTQISSSAFNRISGITIGADPECFLVKVLEDGTREPYPVVGLIGGSKDHPLEIEKGFSLVEDNVMPEFNIPPCTSADEFVNANCKMLEEIIKVVSYIEPGLQLDFSPSLRFNPKYLQTAQAMEFGCMPDFSAYTNRKKQPTADSAGNLRTAGGHIHIGWENGDKEFKTQQAVARAFDFIVLMPFMLIEPENERRALYGAPGSMRPKPYGVECRQLSCFWLSSKELMAWVYNQTLKAIELYNEGGEILDPKSPLCTKVRQLIKDKNLSKVEKFLKKHAGQLV